MRKILQRLHEKRSVVKPLYVNRPLVDADEFLQWARDQGFKKITTPEDLHATILYSKKPVDWGKFTPQRKQLVVGEGGARTVEPLGDEGAVVLKITSKDLTARHKALVAGGGSHDYDSYQAHVTITYDGSGVDLKKVEPFRGPLTFGGEIFKVIDKEWKPDES